MYTVELKHLAQRHAAVATFRAATAADVGAQIGNAFGQVMAHLTSNRVPCEGPAIAMYRRSSEGFEVEAGFYVPAGAPSGEHVRVVVLPAGDAAVTVHTGPYESLPGAYEAIGEWATSHGRELADDMYEEYWSDPQSTPPSEWRTDVVWPVKQAA